MLGVLQRTSLAAALLALLPASAPAQNAVIVTPGADPAASLQGAIDAAADGDILVLAGPWTADPLGPSAIVDGKGLTIMAAAGNEPELLRLHVRNVPAGSTVLVRGLRMSPPLIALPFQEDGRIWLENCAGSVWLEDCEIDGFNSFSWGFGTAFPAEAAVAAHDCAALNLVRCTLRGGLGIDKFNGGMASNPATPGAAAARISASSVALRDCTLKGGRPGKTSPGGLIQAGAGLHLVGGSALLAGGELRGGDDVDETTEPNAGLRAEGAVSVVRRGTSIVAGAGLPVVADVIAPPGAVSEFAAPPRTIAVGSPLHEQQVGELHLAGQPGDMLFVFTSHTGAHQLMPGKQGVFSLGAPVLGPFLLGFVTSPDGKLDLPFTAPDLVGVQTEGWTSLLQLASASGGKALLEGTTSFVLLDASLP